MTILITGGAGFIGSNFVLDWYKEKNERLINLDLLTYASNILNLEKVKNNPNHIFVEGDINDKELITNLLEKYKPRAIINFAAESHVDRSIINPNEFIRTNIIGTFNLLKCAVKYLENKNIRKKRDFIFLHISTDEVFGELNFEDEPFNEESRYAPNSPYSASKASSDHLVRSFNRTYKLPTIITNCSNNYGPYQSTEKFIPLIINRAINLKDIPIYGDGLNIRDWLFVEDHCSALRLIIENGQIGETYNIGGDNEKTNIEVAHIICNLLDKLKPLKNDNKVQKYQELITFIKDRPGHDRRYAINTKKLKKELNWYTKESFYSGIDKTVKWYLENHNWIKKFNEKITLN